jgi:hypothetical protein
MKPRHGLLSGLLHPLPIPDTRFFSLALDFATLPISLGGKDAALVIVDRLTKLVKIIPTTTTVTAESLVQLFLQHWVYTGKGFPQELISDRDPLFLSNAWQEFAKNSAIELKLSTARHQETDGQSEVTIRSIKDCLRAYSDYGGRNWDDVLPAIEYGLNDSVSTTTGYTPFFLTYGDHPRNVIRDGIQIFQLQTFKSCAHEFMDIVFANKDPFELLIPTNQKCHFDPFRKEDVYIVNGSKSLVRVALDIQSNLFRFDIMYHVQIVVLVVMIVGWILAIVISLKAYQELGWKVYLSTGPDISKKRKSKFT